MNLDSLTLMAAGSLVTAMSAFLLLVAWTQMRGPALLWWAAGALAAALGVAILTAGMASGRGLVILAGLGVMNVSPPMIWAGAVSFSHRKQSYPLLVAGPLLWAVSGIVPLHGMEQQISQVIGFVIWPVYLGAAAVELWRGRGERLMARWPLIAFLLLHAFVFAGGVFDALTGGIPNGIIPPLTSWFSLIHFETLIFAIGSSVFIVLMVKERSESRYIFAARHDSLTGIANRGAFLHAAERVLRRCQSEARSCSLAMFDLDRFKRINYNFGHEAGDEVLRTFADTTLSVLRPNDLFGRYGGEEFVVLLPGATIEAAYVIAERIRYKFAEIAATLDDHAIGATVSAGVAPADAEISLEAMLRAADRALYSAKDLGRNRVERAVSERPADTARIIRIA